ncbi:MAG: hypothetical protein EXS67_03455 [Candidatus Margulisbacteria bacterium]|nr:hypothetical protein [Candidatus Margulisiibacteriota bacterium]
MHKIISTHQGPRVPGPIGDATVTVLAPRITTPNAFESDQYPNKFKQVMIYYSSNNEWPAVGDTTNGEVIFPNMNYQGAFWKYHKETKNAFDGAKRQRIEPNQNLMTKYTQKTPQPQISNQPQISKTDQEKQLNKLIDEHTILNSRLESLKTPSGPRTELQERAKGLQLAWIEQRLAEYTQQIKSIQKQTR